jgi:general secretion pathway protein M
VKLGGGLANVRERFDRLEQREQRLLLILVGVFGALIVLAVPIVLSATAASRKSENESIREALAALDEARPKLEAQDADRQKVLAHYAKPAPPLAGFLEQHATAHQIEIPESQDQSLVKHGKKFEERSTKVVLQKVGMKSFSQFLEEVENAGFPVRVSALDLRKRATEPDSYDISLSVSAYDRKEPEKKPAEAPSGDSKKDEEP